MSKIIRPPFTADSAGAKVQAAENAWNIRNPEVVAKAYTEDSQATAFVHNQHEEM